MRVSVAHESGDGTQTVCLCPCSEISWVQLHRLSYPEGALQLDFWLNHKGFFPHHKCRSHLSL